jgi:hypothetical protein
MLVSAPVSFVPDPGGTARPAKLQQGCLRDMHPNKAAAEEAAGSSNQKK